MLIRLEEADQAPEGRVKGFSPSYTRDLRTHCSQTSSMLMLFQPETRGGIRRGRVRRIPRDDLGPGDSDLVIPPIVARTRSIRLWAPQK